MLIITTLLLSTPSVFRPIAKAQSDGAGFGVPDDWTHRHLIFSTPSSVEQSYRLGADPRYFFSRVRRVGAPNPPNHRLPFPSPSSPSIPQQNEGGLWGQSLSTGSNSWAASGAGIYPAKFGFNDTSSVNCGSAASPDFVAFGLQSGTVATQTGTFTGSPTSAQTVTLGGSLVLTASASTSATGTVTIANVPSPQDTVTVGRTTYTWQPSSPTAATGTVTLSSEPAYQDKVTVGHTTYIWQSAANATSATGTVTLGSEPDYQDKVTVGSTTYIWQSAANAMSATGTVTFSNEPAYQDKVTVGSTTYIWQSASATPAAGTVTLTNQPNDGDEVVVGSTTYIWKSSCTGVNNCLAVNSPTKAAKNLANALGGNCGGNTCAANTSATGSAAAEVVTIAAIVAGPSGNFALSLPVNTALNSVSGGNNGTGSCAGVADCVALDTNTTNDATNLKNAIGGACAGIACAVNGSVTATSSVNVAILTSKTPGPSGNFTLTLPVNAGGNSVSGGNNGTNSCAGVNNCVVLDANPNNDATNLKNAIAGSCGGNACAANASATATSSVNVVTLTSRTTGPSGDFTLTLPVNVAGNSVSGGNNGSNSCAGVNNCILRDANPTNDATNLKNAIGGACGGNACASNPSVTATASGSVVTLTAPTTGAAGDFTLTLPVNVAGNAVSGGANGGDTCTGRNNCVVIDGNTKKDATNLSTAVGGACGGNACSANAFATGSSAGSAVTLTARTAGSTGNFTLSLPVNTAQNTVSGGSNGTDGANTGSNFQTGVTTTGNAANLAAAINRNGSAVGVIATSASGVVTVKSTIGGPITLGETLANFSWTSGTIAGTLTGGSTSQATIVAYANLYSSCSGPFPGVYWAYNTSTSTATSAQVVSSPVLSVDGTQLAFVERSGTTAYLVILKWRPGQGTTAWTPVTPGTQATTGANYVTCKAGAGSCQLTLSLGADDADSSPFVDYAHDILYVGDNNGKLHQVTGVFKGTPTLDTTNAGWPVAVKPGATLTSPVFDFGSSLVFIGDSSGTLDSVTTGASPTIRTSSKLEYRTGGISGAPIVDSTTGSVYVFVSCDAACTAATNNAVFKFPTSFTSGAGAEQALGATGTTITNQSVPAGAFDNTYYSGAGNTGNLYACGYTTGLAPALYKIPMSAPWGSAPVTSTPLAGGAGACSQPTENLSGVANTDWLFLSVSANGNLSGCTGDCIYSFNIFSGSPVLSSGRQSTAGSSGIIIDNSATTAGASQIYYTTAGVATTVAGYACPSPSAGAGLAATSGGCAVQAAQTNLQ